MIMKRKLEELQPLGPVDCIPKYCFGFSVPEIDKIMLDRLPKNQISRLKWPQSQSKTLLGIDSAPVADLTGRLPEDILSSIISLISAEALDYLRTFCCDPLEKVEIHDAIIIASIEYDAKMFGQFLLKNSAQPVRICTTLDRRTLQRDRISLQSDPTTQMTYILGTLAKDYPLLEALLVITTSVEIDIIPMHLTTFTRLKQLKLLGVRCRREILLDLTSAFLEAAPSLVELEMDLKLSCTGEEKIEHQKIVDGTDYTEHKKIPLKEYCQHQCLK